MLDDNEHKRNSFSLVPISTKEISISTGVNHPIQTKINKSESWNDKMIAYDKKKARKWKNDFTSSISTKPPLFLGEERRRIRILASGWKNIKIPLPERPKKIFFDAQEKNIKRNSIDKNKQALRNRGNFCFSCWGLVGVGNDRKDCTLCMAVIHIECINSITTTTTNDIEKNEEQSTSSSEEMPFSRLAPKSTWKNSLTWTCPDCLEEAESSSHYQVR